MRFAVVLLLATTACILPKTELTRTPGETRRSNLIVDRAGEVELTTRREEGRIRVTAERVGHCHRDIHQTTIVTETKKARLVGGGGLTLLLVLAYPVGIGSLVVSGLANAGNGTKTHEVEELIATHSESCRTSAGNVAIRVDMPSGIIVEGVTDERGVLEIDDEPGEVRVALEIEMGQAR